MPRHDAELEALSGLGEYERGLDEQLERARQEARRGQDEARESADRLKQASEAELLRELELVRAQSAAQVERSLATIRDETGRLRQALREAAGRNRERTLVWLLDRVAGRG